MRSTDSASAVASDEHSNRQVQAMHLLLAWTQQSERDNATFEQLLCLHELREHSNSHLK